MNGVLFRRLVLLGCCALAAGLNGCRVARLAGRLTRDAFGTTARVGGHAVGATKSALTLNPRGVVGHARGATQDVLRGAESATTTAVEDTVGMATSLLDIY